MVSLWFVLSLRGLLFLLELWAGWESHSLSLLAGAGHLFSDLLTLGLTLVAAWLIEYRSTGWAALHYRQIAAVMGLLNGLSLTLITATIGWQAIAHLRSPEPLPSLYEFAKCLLQIVRHE
ncbi:MAG: cation transporter [Cyanosarcina radialis HA8281-LM2]|nr:cation transporter [Cyanosarcina radialis HA8281-LM2]